MYLNHYYNNDLTYLSNFSFSEIISNNSYIASKNCMVLVSTTTNSVNFGIIKTKIGNIYIRVYQNSSNIENLQDAFLISLKKDDILSVAGDVKSYDFYIYS